MSAQIDERRAEFQRVLDYAGERAWAEGVEEDLMAALFDVFEASARRTEKARRRGAVSQGLPHPADALVRCWRRYRTQYGDDDRCLPGR
jgi:hypothetical protein